MKTLQEHNRGPHLLAGMALRPWLGLLWGSGITKLQRLSDVLEITARSIQQIPLKMRERSLFARQVASHTIHPHPVFIVGHYRSGTTYLHSLLAHDPNYAFPTNFQVSFPDAFLSAEDILKPALRKRLPPRRAFDDVCLDVDGPQEEEFAMACLSPYSFFHCLYFPRQLDHHFDRGVLLSNERDRKHWQAIYRKFLTKVSLKAGGRPLLIKNPANSARIGTLLGMFPNAKLIHLYRNPYTVYLSTARFVRIFNQAYGLQAMSATDVQALVLAVYPKIMRRLFHDLDGVPRSQVTHVCYEHLLGHELAVLETIYRELNMGAFEQVRVRFETHVAAQSEFQKSTHRLEEAVRDIIGAKWAFAFEKLGYDPAGAMSAPPLRSSGHALSHACTE